MELVGRTISVDGTQRVMHLYRLIQVKISILHTVVQMVRDSLPLFYVNSILPVRTYGQRIAMTILHLFSFKTPIRHHKTIE